MVGVRRLQISVPDVEKKLLGGDDFDLGGARAAQLAETGRSIRADSACRPKTRTASIDRRASVGSRWSAHAQLSGGDGPAEGVAQAGGSDPAGPRGADAAPLALDAQVGGGGAADRHFGILGVVRRVRGRARKSLPRARAQARMSTAGQALIGARIFKPRLALFSAKTPIRESIPVVLSVRDGPAQSKAVRPPTLWDSLRIVADWYQLADLLPKCL